ncbi:MAG: hypothetical protein P8Y71_15330, partial [Pseudolabrys sp.]
ATPSSRYSLDYRRSDARTVENGFATNGGLSKSAKVVLGSGVQLIGGLAEVMASISMRVQTGVKTMSTAL